VAQYPVVGGGTRVDDQFVSSMIDNWVIKPADATPRTTITMVADPDLTFNVVANALYDVEMVVRFAGLQVAGIRTAWTVPTGTSGNRLVGGPGDANAVSANASTTEMRWSIHGYATQVGYTNPRNSTTLQVWFLEKALVAVGSTAGAVTLTWGQLTANATGTLVNANSYIRYRRVG
jgi:hypothetical protein